MLKRNHFGPQIMLITWVSNIQFYMIFGNHVRLSTINSIKSEVEKKKTYEYYFYSMVTLDLICNQPMKPYKKLVEKGIIIHHHTTFIPIYAVISLSSKKYIQKYAWWLDGIERTIFLSRKSFVSRKVVNDYTLNEMWCIIILK